MSKKKSNKKSNFSIKILEIKEVSFSNKITDEIANAFSEDNFSYEVGMSVSGDKKENIVTLGVVVKFMLKNDNSKRPTEFIKLQTENKFKLIDANKDTVEYIKDDKIFLSDQLMGILLMTSFGALRGMLAYKMASLPINLVLPLIDASYFINSQEKENNVDL